VRVGKGPSQAPRRAGNTGPGLRRQGSGRGNALARASTATPQKPATVKKSVLSARKIEVKSKLAQRRQDEQVPLEARQGSGNLGGGQGAVGAMGQPGRKKACAARHSGTGSLSRQPASYRKPPRVRLKNMKHPTDKYRAYNGYGEEDSASGASDGGLRGAGVSDPLGLLATAVGEGDEDEEEEELDVTSTIVNANEVWMEIQLVDARFQHLQQNKGPRGAGSDLDGHAQGFVNPCTLAISLVARLVGALAFPFIEVGKAIGNSIYETEAMQKYLYKHGYKVYGTDPRVDLHKQDFEALLLRESDVGLLFKLFMQIDEDESGEVSMTELLTFLGLQQNKFAQSVFAIMDEDKSGQIDFREFVVAAWNYCTLSKGTLVMFAFDLYDDDHSGFIDGEEVEAMLRDVYGREFSSAPQANHIIVSLRKMSEESGRSDLSIKIDHAEFFDFCRNHPGLLYPAFRLQNQLRAKILGEAFWDEKASARLFLSDGKYISAARLLQLHVERSAMAGFVSKYKEQEDQDVVRDALTKTGILRMRQLLQSMLNADATMLDQIEKKKEHQDRFRNLLQKAEFTRKLNVEFRRDQWEGEEHGPATRSVLESVDKDARAGATPVAVQEGKNSESKVPARKTQQGPVRVNVAPRRR